MMVWSVVLEVGRWVIFACDLNVVENGEKGFLSFRQI